MSDTAKPRPATRAIRVGDYILPRAELFRRLANTGRCACGAARYFSDRLRDDGMCRRCSRNTP